MATHGHIAVRETRICLSKWIDTIHPEQEHFNIIYFEDFELSMKFELEIIYLNHGKAIGIFCDIQVSRSIFEISLGRMWTQNSKYILHAEKNEVQVVKWKSSVLIISSNFWSCSNFQSGDDINISTDYNSSNNHPINLSGNHNDNNNKHDDCSEPKQLLRWTKRIRRSTYIVKSSTV